MAWDAAGVIAQCWHLPRATGPGRDQPRTQENIHEGAMLARQGRCPRRQHPSLFCSRTEFSLCDTTNPNAEIARKAMGQSPAGLFGFSHMLGGVQTDRRPSHRDL